MNPIELTNMRRVAARALALLVLPASAWAVSNGTQAGGFLLIADGPRAVAMGEAFAGLADDVTAASWNPAGLTQMGGLEASLGYTDWFADTSYSMVAFGGPVTARHFAAGTLRYFHVPRIANVPEDVEPGVDLTNVAVGPAYAFRWSDRLSFGAALKFLSQGVTQEGRPASAASSALVDLGVQYHLAEPAVSAGFVLQNMGARLKFRDAKSPTPFWARLGLAWRVWRDEWLEVAMTGDVSQPIDTGYRLVIPEGGFADFFKLSLKGPKQNRYNWALGTEWRFARILAVRAGWTTRIGSDIDSPSAGAGVRFAVDPFTYALDYSWSYWSDLSANVSRVALTIGYRPRAHETED